MEFIDSSVFDFETDEFFTADEKTLGPTSLN